MTLLHDATTRVVYDLDRFANSRRTTPISQSGFQPVRRRLPATHVRAVLPPHGLKIQLSFSYSDGFGLQIQKKVQAEPGPVVNGGPTVDPRWVGTGGGSS